MHNGCHAWLLHENTKRVAHRLEDNHGLKKQVLASSPPELYQNMMQQGVFVLSAHHSVSACYYYFRFFTLLLTIDRCYYHHQITYPIKKISQVYCHNHKCTNKTTKYIYSLRNVLLCLINYGYNQVNTLYQSYTVLHQCETVHSTRSSTVVQVVRNLRNEGPPLAMHNTCTVLQSAFSKRLQLCNMCS